MLVKGGAFPPLNTSLRKKRLGRKKRLWIVAVVCGC
jgi:hypothetical protein